MSVLTFIPGLFFAVHALCTFYLRHIEKLTATIRVHLSGPDADKLIAWLNLTTDMCDLIKTIEGLL